MITKLYAQTDPRWADEILGFNSGPPFTIGNYGCVVTAIGNLEYAITGNGQFTPEFINNWGKAHGGFEEKGGLAIWDAYLALGNLKAQGETTNLQELNNFLQAAPNFAIVEFQLPGHQHYCMAPYVGKIIDSEDGLLKSMGTYPFVLARLYTSTVAPANPTPPPAAPPAPAAPAAPTITVATVVNASSGLLMRSGPGTSYEPVLGQNADGSPLFAEKIRWEGNVITATVLPNGESFQVKQIVEGAPVNGNTEWAQSMHDRFVSCAYLAITQRGVAARSFLGRLRDLGKRV